MSSSYINQTIAATEAIVPVAGAGIAVTPVPSGIGLSISNTTLSQTQTVRVVYASNPLGSGNLSSSIPVNFSTPFADGNYTVSLSIEVAEAIMSATVSASFEKQGTPGNGVTVWVLNNDSVVHNVTVHVTARHD